MNLQYKSFSHDQLSRITCDSILKKWRDNNPSWVNNFICNDIFYINSSSSWPSPDRSFYSPKNKTNIAVEYKPFRETKRGILTGLGQSMVYLKKNSASYLVIPNKVQDDLNFDIGNYMEKFFNKFIKGKLPIGLVVYKYEDPSIAEIKCNIDLSLIVREKIKEPSKDESYWAAWRDWPAMSYYYLLEISKKIDSESNVKKKIWDDYWDNYYLKNDNLELSKKITTTLELITNKIIGLDNGYMIPAKGKKRELKKQLNSGKISPNESINLLKRFIAKENIKENLYQNYKKNHFNFMNHCKLWDPDRFRITPIGEKYIKRIKDNNDPMKELSLIALFKGRHVEIIYDIINASKELKPEDKNDLSTFKFKLEKNLMDKGYIKKNPGRSTTGIRKFLQSELQLWNHSGVIKKNGSTYFYPREGLKFNMKKIEELQIEYSNVYGNFDYMLGSVSEVLQ